MTTLIRRTRLARVSGLALTLVLAGQCQLPTSAQQLPAGTAAQPAPAPAHPQYDRVRDRRAIDDRRDRFHGHSHCGDEPRHR